MPSCGGWTSPAGWATSSWHSPGPLAGRAVPGATAGDADLLDRCSAPVARLASPAVHLELVLHAASGAVGLTVVAQRRALACDADLERLRDRAAQGAKLDRVEPAGGSQGVDARAPESLVDVDVSHSRQ